jgi:hypothetical protein
VAALIFGVVRFEQTNFAFRSSGAHSYCTGERKVSPMLTLAAIRRPSEPKTEALLLCPNCRLEMRLFGSEQESVKRDLYTFECVRCSHLEVRGVLVA